MAGARKRNEAAAARFGRNLLMARRRAGYSQEELAVRCSLHRTEIGFIEKGKRLPRVDTLVKLITALEVKAEELLQGIEWTLPPVALHPPRGSLVVKPPA